jgi:hypothetical protein
MQLADPAPTGATQARSNSARLSEPTADCCTAGAPTFCRLSAKGHSVPGLPTQPPAGQNVRHPAARRMHALPVPGLPTQPPAGQNVRHPAARRMHALPVPGLPTQPPAGQNVRHPAARRMHALPVPGLPTQLTAGQNVRHPAARRMHALRPPINSAQNVRAPQALRHLGYYRRNRSCENPPWSKPGRAAGAC